MKASFPWFGNATTALKCFFEDLGAEAIVPPPPTRRTMELGVRYSPEQICLPFKITLGNLIEAAGLGADTLFMAAGTRKCRFGYYHLVQEGILAEYCPGARLFALSQYSAADFVLKYIPEIFGVTPGRAAQAVVRLLARSAAIEDLDNAVRSLRVADFARAEEFTRDGLRLIARTRTLRDIRSARRELHSLRLSLTPGRRPLTPDPGSQLRIGLVGEVYLMIEPFANSEIEKELGRLGALVVTERSLYRHLLHLLRSDMGAVRSARLAHRYIGESPGGEVTKTLGEAIHYARNGIDGVIHVFPFTCMPENMALEILQQVSVDYGIPVMSLSFDEHTSRTGLVTRLEAFADMLQRRKGRRQARCA